MGVILYCALLFWGIMCPRVTWREIAGIGALAALFTAVGIIPRIAQPQDYFSPFPTSAVLIGQIIIINIALKIVTFSVFFFAGFGASAIGRRWRSKRDVTEGGSE